MTLEEIKNAHKTLEDLQRLLTCYRHISSELTEANGIAIQALERAEKYKWHDLRENPKDLPELNVVVLVAEPKLDSGFCEMYETDKLVLCAGDEKDWMYHSDVVAWKYIEPFTRSDSE